MVNNAHNVTALPELQESKFPVMEIFGPTIQGEGALIGIPTHFVRLGGCTYRCKWCDTMFAVDPIQVKAERTMMTPNEILDTLDDIGPNIVQWVTISGGDPMMHKHLDVLVDALRDAGWNVAIETQGAILHENELHCDHLTISPKPPSSGMETDMDVLRRYMEAVETERIADSYCVKIVVFNEADLRWANNIACKLGLEELYLQVGTQQEDLSLTGYRNHILHGYEWLVNEVLVDEASRAQYKYPRLQDIHNLVLLPQMHALIWHNARGK